MSKFMKTGILPVAAAAAAIAVATPASAIDMKVGYPTTADPQHDLALHLVKLIGERTNGEIKGRVFPTSQLGKIPRQVEGIQLGTQEVFLAPPGFLQGVNPAFQVADAPGLFKDHMHVHRSVNEPSFRDKFLALGEGKGIVGGHVYTYDGTSYMTTTPIKTLADLKGKKIRVLATQMEREIVGQFGATGVPIPFTEVVPAIQRKVVDGARTSLVVAAKAKFPTVTKNLTIVNGAYITTGAWFSKVWLGKLSNNHRKIVMDTAAEVAEWGSKNSLSFVAAMEEEWKKQGASVYRFSPEEQAHYMKTIAPLGDKLLGGNKNPQIREMYGLLKASAKKNM
ncbi:MAG: TRAP transporter substrate-binding protein [Alphaproteobacteria bacterium]